MTQLRINIAGIKIVKKVANERWQKRKQPTKDGRKESSKRKMTEKKGRNKEAF